MSSQAPDTPAAHDAVHPASRRAVAFASSGGRFYAVLMAVFVAIFLISNISATKLIAVGPLVMDGGAILFPMAYVMGGILSEVYGFAAARRAILVGFAVQVLATLVFTLVMLAPPGPGYEAQAAFEAVLGFYPRIVLASLAGYLVGQLLNSFIIVWIKKRVGEHHLWARFAGSTVVGQFIDTVIFCTVAFAGVISGGDFLNYVVTGFVYKCLVEFLLLPVTYAVVGWLKRHEPSYRRPEDGPSEGTLPEEGSPRGRSSEGTGSEHAGSKAAGPKAAGPKAAAPNGAGRESTTQDADAPGSQSSV